MVNMGTKRVKMHADHWTQSTLDRKASAHFEHTIAVTNDGPRLLTGPPSTDELSQLPWEASSLVGAGAGEKAVAASR
jgi:methionyl aminopeptidase